MKLTEIFHLRALLRASPEELVCKEPYPLFQILYSRFIVLLLSDKSCLLISDDRS
jgi:hypothetical protein